MRPRTELRLYGGQETAIRATEPEVLVLGNGRPVGASHLLRVAGLFLAFRHPGARIALVAKTAESLRRTHLEGSRGLPAMLADMQRHGAAVVSDVDVRLANGARLWWSGAFRDTEVTDLLRQPIDALLVDDLEAIPEDLYRRLAERVTHAGAAPRRVLAASRELAGWMAERWVPGSAGRRVVALRAEDLPVEVTADLVDDDAAGAPDGYEEWLAEMFPRAFGDGFAPYQREFWRWLEAIVPGLRPRPFVGIWPRGGGKSTSAEAGAVRLGAKGVRRYAAIVRATQEQADHSVENVGALLESDAVARRYPELAGRAVSKYGTSKGWRRNRLRTASGFVVDGLGLDTAARGLKVEEQRPDLIILDDVDDRNDTEKATAKKLRTLTSTILPIGAPGAAVLAIQNLILPDGVFARLADGRADFLIDRIVSGPHKSVDDLVYRRDEEEDGRLHYVITGGTPTWPERGLAHAEAELNTYGPRSFLEENQHELGDREGALLRSDQFRRLVGELDLDQVVTTVVAVDPSGGGATGTCGIVGASRLENGRAVVRADVSQPAKLGPANWAGRSIDLFLELEADAIVAEINFGGDMVKSTIEVAARSRGVSVPVVVVRASRGKRQRAEPVAELYASGLVYHAGEFPELEREWTRWVPGDAESPNRVDAVVWALTKLLVKKRRQFEIR